MSTAFDLEPLARLLAPLTAAEFFRDWYEKKPLHLGGRPPPTIPLLTGAHLMEALIEGQWRDTRLMLNPKAWGATDTAPDLLSMSQDERALQLERYFAGGYPVMWNAGRSATPAIAQLCAELSRIFRARVWPNIYATGASGTPFDFHFDLHEVLAVQCEGRKTWQISALRVDTPLDAPEMAEAVRQALEHGRADAQRNLALEVTVEPGDVIYIPRGQFHNAFTPEGRSLHVTFAIEPPSGYDLLQDLAAQALADPQLRRFLPPPCADPDGAATHAFLDALRARLRELLDTDALEQALDTQGGARMAASDKPPG